MPDDVEAGDDLDPDTWEKITMVEVINHDYGLIWLWDIDKFEDRLCTCRELLNDDISVIE